MFLYSMKIVPTKDGTITLHNDEFNQAYHSYTGAYEEAVEKYTKPTAVFDGAHILDFCFGLGYNSLAAMMHAQNLTIIALENDGKLLSSLSEVPVEFSADVKKVFIEMAEHLAKNEEQFTIGTHSIKVIVDDAAQSVKKVASNSMDIIFFDPFSPSVCPHLWTESIFAECNRVLKKGGILATYSCARKVRDAMRAVDFIVSDGPSIGRRGPSTLARKE